MSFLSTELSIQLGQKLEHLAKSFNAAGYQGLQNAGRTGMSALAKDQIDPILRNITMQESQFLITKNMPTVDAKQTVHFYKVKTQAQSGLDLAGFENFMPQIDAAQYMTVAEVLKIYGTRQQIGYTAELVNEADGYIVDLEKEADENAALAMANAMERDCYVGGDMFIAADGSVDAQAAAQLNGPIRNARGIQANIREGDKSLRGIPGDFQAYGNNQSVVFDRKGGALERGFVDLVVTAVSNNMGALAEAHCTAGQLRDYRATFLSVERADISAHYAVRGPDISNDHGKVGHTMDTIGGPVDFKPTIFKYLRQFPQPVISSQGQSPGTPVVASLTAGSSDTGSGMLVGEVYSYRVQACNISGRSVASASQSVTVTNAGAYNELTITNSSEVEYYSVFRSAKESSAAPAGKEMLIGHIAKAPGASTIFRDNGKFIPGFTSILFLPKDKSHCQMIKLGALLNKLDLARLGLGTEKAYVSCWATLVTKPRSLALADNVSEERQGL
jgi:hypothetical protein